MRTKILSETHYINSGLIQIGVTYHSTNKVRIPVNGRAKAVDLPLARWRNIKYRAGKKKIPFNVTCDQIRELLTRVCEYCNSEDQIQIDRKVPSLGYVYSNLAPACRRCNTIKSDVVTYEEMLKIVEILGWKK